MTDYEYFEVKSKFDFYWNILQDEIELTYKAFIQTQKLYQKPTEEEKLTSKEYSTITDEDLKLWSRMAGMSTKHWSPPKQLSK